MSGDHEDAAAAAREFGHQFSEFMNWAHTVGAADDAPLTRLIKAHLGGADDEPVVSRRWGAFEQVNLQRAVEAWTVQPGREVRVQGLSIPDGFSGVSLGQVIDGSHLPPMRLSAPDVTDLPSGPGESLACWNRALLLVRDAAGPYAVLISGPQPHEEASVRFEIAGLPMAEAQSVLGDLEESRARLNVYRGQTVIASMTPMGGIALTFATTERVQRADVILPTAVLDRIERHAIAISAHADRLTAAGQHLKRGLLLYGPPGTGKTHTVRYLIGARDHATRILMQGEALRAVGQITTLARELAPSVVVLEDVDLVAEDRSYGEINPVLFDLLDAMDGSAADADLLFVLTTNRAEVLERALIQRPGRIDVAVEIDRPDEGARRKLLRLYGAEVLAALSDEDLEQVVERSDGVTASFLKELIRRAVLSALNDDRVSRCTLPDLTDALDDLLDQAQSVTRSLLGLSGDESSDEAVDDGTTGYRSVARPGVYRARPRRGRLP
ncbi:ATP-binding protein [Allobranchiibius sp. CTAmp26]|uniref:ATP-binding protein n=1 Tax=Allobranchiibius sp. CTAmp26 TaxID=2815214 RepID=UPI001AA19763|nr:ATP-binding protein [Allobranchiibius sp. CTAmp26]MBO1756424.1 26S protease regulatory subunit [Allobranchiibius sp. CTAmp26]